jgi:Lrp/AsnC family leucine-responsive transcriptional regulator
MDTTDYKILEALQKDGRISMKDLGQLVALTPPAVSERVRRLEESGVIEGYKAVVNPLQLGKLVKAIINVEMKVQMHKQFLDLAKSENAIIECHHMTGYDCMTITVVVENTIDLERLLDKIQKVGNTRTSIVLSSPILNKPILP